jgi:hypothetical protein
VAQVVEHLPSKCEALSLKPSANQKKERNMINSHKIKHKWLKWKNVQIIMNNTS